MADSTSASSPSSSRELSHCLAFSYPRTIPSLSQLCEQPDAGQIPTHRDIQWDAVRRGWNLPHGGRHAQGSRSGKDFPTIEQRRLQGEALRRYQFRRGSCGNPGRCVGGASRTQSTTVLPVLLRTGSRPERVPSRSAKNPSRSKPEILRSGHVWQADRVEIRDARRAKDTSADDSTRRVRGRTGKEAEIRGVGFFSGSGPGIGVGLVGGGSLRGSTVGGSTAGLIYSFGVDC